MAFNTITLTITQADEGSRLDLVWSNHLPDVSRARIQAWLKASGEKPSRTVRAGEVLSLEQPAPAPATLEAENLPLEIIYQDNDLLVINKPAGLVVHPGAGNSQGTLVNALLYHFPGLSVGDKERPGIVHRLDKDTSGLMIIARNDLAHTRLSQAFKNREVRKIYRALCVGRFKESSFELKTGHQRHPTNRKRFTTKYPTERIAHSKFEVLSCHSGLEPESSTGPRVRRGGTVFSEVRVEIFTGRTHQIRAQLADIGHPILGDLLYGGPKIPGFNRHALHAEELFFNHPITGEPLHFRADPSDINPVRR